MALQDLLTALRAQAAERRSEVLARARAEADRIRAEGDLSLERRRDAVLAKAREDEEAVSRRAIARARAEAAETVLAARDRLLDRVRSALAERIARAEDDPEYRRVLADELEAALGRLPTGAVQVRARESLAAVVREALGGADRVSVEVSPKVGTGFLALASDGGVEVDATLEARLEHVWPRLAVGVLAEVVS